MLLGHDTFVATLAMAKPALAEKSPLQALGYFWFDGENVHAYNDVLGVIAPAKTDFKAGIEGALLLGLLEHSSGDVSLQVENSVALLEVSGAVAKLPVLPWESHIWDSPGLPDGSNAIEYGEDFIAALAGVLISVGAGGPGVPPAGVSLVKEGGNLAFYASDGKSLSWARLPAPDVSDFGYVVLPGPFCEQLVKLRKGTLAWWKDGATVLTDNVQVFSKLVAVETLPNYADSIARYLAPGGKEHSAPVPVPPKLSPALERVMVLLGDRPELMEVSASEKVLKLALKVPAGQIKEEIALDKDHYASVRDIRFDPGLIKQIVGRANQFLVSPDCWAFLGAGDSGCLVASITKA